MSKPEQLSPDDATLDGATMDLLRAELERDGLEVEAWGAATSVGRVRENNEDSWGTSSGSVFVVADGMGGLPGGGEAAEAVVKAMTSGRVMVPERGTTPTKGTASAQARTPSEGLAWGQRVVVANLAVRAVAARLGVPSSGAAFVGLTVGQEGVKVANLGDSRCYLYRSGGLAQLTRDHTLSAEMKAEGLGDLLATRTHQERRSLTRYVGSRDDRAVPHVVGRVPIPGDRFLLCSDGVHGQLDDQTIGAILALDDPSGAAHRLVAAAEEAGGRDNATALVIDFGASG